MSTKVREIFENAMLLSFKNGVRGHDLRNIGGL